MSWIWHQTLRLVIACSLITTAACLSVTYPLEAKGKRCFFQDVDEGASYTIDVFVFQGGGAHDLRVTVKDKSHREKLNERISKVIWKAKLDGAHEEVYEICLQNARGSKEDTKHVMLTVDKDSLPVGKDPGTLDPKGQASQGSGDIQVISGSVKNLENILLDISNKLSEEDKAMVERMTAAEDNRRSMKNSSIVETLVLLVVSLGQIFFVRHWFQGKGTILKRWM